jgi:hypothetical protein
MTTEAAQIIDSLSQRYRNLQKTLNDLSIDAAMYHSTLPIHDDVSRNLFNALSRIMAISDQVHMALSLMGEDVKTVEDTLADPMTAFWRDQLEDGFEDWIYNPPLGTAKVH